MNIPTVIIRFLRFGGSSWELNIDPKRVPEKINNDFDEDKARRSENNDINNDKANRSKEVMAIVDLSLFGVPGSSGKDNINIFKEQNDNCSGSNTPMAKGQADFYIYIYPAFNAHVYRALHIPRLISKTIDIQKE